jgi:methylmalonyl-CoA mutase C-terminal domain/subunit
MDDVLLIGGGIIPDDDAENLNKLGVARLFPPGTDTSAIASYINDWVAKNRNF